jgi:uncharacterized protein YcaQ
LGYPAQVREQRQINGQDVQVEGWKAPGYIHPDDRKQVEAAAKGEIQRSKTTFLSPFDPLVWDRGRALDLYNNALIGRIDLKAHREEGVFEVKALHLEPGVAVDDALVAEVNSALRACARFAHLHRT